MQTKDILLREYIMNKHINYIADYKDLKIFEETFAFCNLYLDYETKKLVKGFIIEPIVTEIGKYLPKT